MRKFAFGRGSKPIMLWPIVKFLIGWHGLTYCVYRFYWKPLVMKRAKENGYEWSELSSGKKITAIQQYYNVSCGLILKQNKTRKDFNRFKTHTVFLCQTSPTE